LKRSSAIADKTNRAMLVLASRCFGTIAQLAVITEKLL